MFTYFRQNCQCKIALLCCLFLWLPSCAGPQKEELRPIDALPFWLKVDEKFSPRQEDGSYLTHPFFDLVPFAHPDDQSLNFFPLTAQGSSVGYELDLLSGREYADRKYCKQKDAWEKYPDEIFAPPFTEGIVPRLLDGLGSAQKIIVFGRPELYQSIDRRMTRSYRVRIVGGLVMQYCKNPPCGQRSTWDSYLLLVGVDSMDKKYEQVKEISQLKKQVDWDYVIAFLQNGRGRKVTKRANLPAYRLIGEVAGQKALAYALSKGHFFKFDELISLRKNCHKLYDYFWQKAEKIRTTPKPDNDNGKKELQAYKKQLNKTNVIVEEYQSGPKKLDQREYDFYKFFEDFYNKYADRFYTCTRFVRYSNINNSVKRHWFLTYMDLYFKLEKLGNFYNCEKRAWLDNPLNLSNTRTFNPSKDRGRCREKDFDRAFDAALSKLGGLRQSAKEYYSYLTYDSAPWGSHEKMYAWKLNTGKTMSCQEQSKNAVKDILPDLFPSNVDWEAYGHNESIKGKDYLIR